MSPLSPLWALGPHGVYRRPGSPGTAATQGSKARGGGGDLGTLSGPSPGSPEAEGSGVNPHFSGPSWGRGCGRGGPLEMQMSRLLQLGARAEPS